jgi:hypothetical protein
MSTNASLIICDDVRVEFNGKVIMIGVYTGDMLIPAEPFIASQLYFFFYIDTPIDESPNKVTLEVTMPQQDASRWEFPIPEITSQPGRTKFVFKQPVSLLNPILHCGRIAARVLLDEKSLDVATMWITKPQQLPTSSIAG